MDTRPVAVEVDKTAINRERAERRKTVVRTVRAQRAEAAKPEREANARYFLGLELETLRTAFVALRQASPAARLRLFESGQLHVEADEILAKSRARQAERIADKRAKL